MLRGRAGDGDHGSTVDVVVWRGGKEVPLKLRVGEQEEAEKQNVSAQGQKKPAEPDQQEPDDHQERQRRDDVLEGLHPAPAARPAARVAWRRASR